MTDKTDIDALRSEAANIIGLLTAAGHETFSLDKTADFFDDVFRLLEAECQQRAAAEITSESYKNILGVAIKELAALRGEQEPVAWIVHARAGDQLTTDGDYVANAEGMGGIHSTPLYRQPTPVVVLNSSAVMSRSYVVKQIEAAGIVVKDGE